jgi:hypothetical protein
MVVSGDCTGLYHSQGQATIQLRAVLLDQGVDDLVPDMFHSTGINNQYWLATIAENLAFTAAPGGWL